jgi:hypothetical protein
MLKLCPEKIAVPLQIIFNKSLLQCKYPTSWKIVLLNILGENQIDIHKLTCFFADG